MSRKDKAGGQYGPNSWATSTCSTGKRTWARRADAREYANRNHRGGHDRLSPYRCDECGLFHVGHLPRAVLAGTMTRNEYYGRAS